MFPTVLLLLEYKTKRIFAPTALSKIKLTSAILFVDLCFFVQIIVMFAVILCHQILTISSKKICHRIQYPF